MSASGNGEVVHPYRWLAVLAAVAAWVLFNISLAYSATHADQQQYDTGAMWLSLVLVDISTLGLGAAFLWNYARHSANGGSAQDA